MSKKNPIDKLFQEGLGEHKIEPSAKVWEKIEGSIEAKERKKGGVFLLRAAAVALLIGLPGMLLFQVSQKPKLPIEADNIAGSFGQEPIIEEISETEPKGTDEKKEGVKTQTNEKKEIKPEKRKAIPLIRDSKNTNEKIYVSNEKLDIDENSIVSGDDFEGEEEEPLLETTRGPKIKIKIKLKPKKTVESFYANKEKEDESEERKNIKDMVYAYAGEQVDNLLNGKPVELPKSKAESKLELNWNKLFKD